ncbi:MAG TPA: TonB family protein, partial [Pyrinomonadaceae bacterium]|nr:TonB family protein [Pyrinomonadaceae bacterium]
VVVSASVQKIAVLAPDRTPLETTYSTRFSSAIAGHLKVLDGEMADAAFRSVTVDDPFNLSVELSKNIGSVIGCDYFVLLRTGMLRRVSLNRPDYFEAFAAAYVVSSRTGRLMIWKLEKAEAETVDKAERQLLPSADILARETSDELPAFAKIESTEPSPQPLEEVPADGTPAAKNFRAPVPYRRIAPEYTPLAYLYGDQATVEIQVDLDADGNFLRTEIVRWAGFGLDESVDAAVRKMNWRPAERNGKTLPIRFLLRYNFKKIEKE